MGIVRTYINEKFTQDTDPIKDLNIGLVKYWKESFKKFQYYAYTQECYDGEKFSDLVKFPNIYFKSICLAVLVRIIYFTLKNIVNAEKNVNINNIFKNVVKKQLLDLTSAGLSELEKQIEEDAKKILKEKYKVDVDSKENIIINEKFTQDSDPIDDLGIGMKARLAKWLNKHKDDLTNANIEKFQWGLSKGYDGILAFCASQNKFEFVKYLVEANLISNIRYSQSLALRWAASTGNVKMIKFLVENGASPNEPSIDAALTVAVFYRNDKAIEYLMKVTDNISYSVIERASTYNIQLAEKLKKLKEEKDGKSK